MEGRREQAVELLARFAARTGLSAPGPPRRYLWTDAFAVCTWLGLARGGEPRARELALQLIDAVHHVLGRHRADDRRRGWISGLADEQGEAHPTAGGLRIGKTLPERGATEPFDERLEWDRDGQYFHYLTKWMHALDQAWRATGQALFNRWARELALAAHCVFAYAPAGGGAKRMRWKLSIDLSRPLVASMGQHDPLDALVTYAQLEASAPGQAPRLADALADVAAMIEPRALVTADPLGLGGLLADAYRLAQLPRRDGAERLIETLLETAHAGLRHYESQADLGLPAAHRLAFRELGLAIGLAALQRDDWTAGGAGVRARLAALSPYAALRAEIEAFWLQPAHRRAQSWLAHADINDVMLAASLQPDGFLVLAPPPG